MPLFVSGASAYTRGVYVSRYFDGIARAWRHKVDIPAYPGVKPPFLPSGAFTVRGATITGLESIKEGKGYWWLCTSEPLGRYKTLYLSNNYWFQCEHVCVDG